MGWWGVGDVSVVALHPRHYRGVLEVARQAGASWPGEWSDLSERGGYLVGLAALLGHPADVLGYGFYEHRRERAFELCHVVVHPAHRRSGVGSAIVRRVAGSVRLAGGVALAATVPERDLDTQLFLRGCGFRCIGIRGSEYRFTMPLAAVREPECSGR